MTRFAKLFEVDPIGQILVLLDTNDEGNPAIKIMYVVPSMNATATMILSFPDTESGFDEAERSFEEIDGKRAAGLVTLR